jgi:glyoxylase-like metal-dependent hydrolase (beta-lactamase superfamily II)
MVDEILDGVHDITVDLWDSGRRYRAYLFEEDVPTLFDTGFDHSTGTLFDAVDEVGVEPERLVITHEDPDHTGAFDAVTEEYDLEVYVPAGDAGVVREQFPDVDIDHEYEDGDTIGRWEAVHCPGHTPGLSALVDEDAGLAVTGDVVFGSDLRGLPEGYLIPPPEIYSDDLAQAERSMEHLAEYDFDVALVSHGTAVMEGASDKLRSFVDFPGKPDRGDH